MNSGFVPKPREWAPLVGLVVLVSLTTAASPAQGQTGVIFEVGKYDSNYPIVCPDTRDWLTGEDRCCVGCTNLCEANCDYYSHAAVIIAWMNGFGYSAVNRYQNTGVDEKDFYTRTTTYDWARDYNSPYGYDSADVAWYGGHGSMRCTKTWDDPLFIHPAGYAGHGESYNASRFTMGEQHPGYFGGNYQKTCEPVTTHETDTALFMRFGNSGSTPDQPGTLQVALLWGCRQGYYWVWHGGGFDSVRVGTMAMWNGWHSHSQIGTNWVATLNQYGFLAFSIGGAGEHWVDMSRYSTNPIKHDHCLTSVVWGTGDSDIINRFENSRLAGTGNLPSVVNPIKSGIFYYAGCSPYASPPDGLDLPGTRGDDIHWTFKNGA
jgi:hypothetical protein